MSTPIACPGIVALVMQDGHVVYEKAFGWADKEAGRRMTTDTIFRIASQTKALTSTAVMQLVEEGSLALDARAPARSFHHSRRRWWRSRTSAAS